MKINVSLQNSLLTSKKLWLWYGVTILVAITFLVLLYYFPKHQSLIILLLSLLVIMDAFLINFFHLGKNDHDSRMWSIIYFVVGLLGAIWGVLIGIQLLPVLPAYSIAPIALLPSILTSQIIKTLLMKRNNA